MPEMEITAAQPVAPSAFTAAQQRAIQARHPLVALSAGAGSGKTAVLVERFVALVDEGASPLEIVAITFTDKAAAEMKERVIQRFQARGDEENRRRAEAAYISTIHGFCARLLREQPFAARLDPSFGIIDGLERGLFLDQQLAELYRDSWFREHVDRFRRPDRRSREPALPGLILDAALGARGFGRDEPEEAGYDVEQHVEAALARLAAYEAALRSRLREQLLAVASVLMGADVSGPKSQQQHRRLCEFLSDLMAGGELNAAEVEEFDSVTGFTRSLVKGPEAEVVRAAMDAPKGSLKKLKAIKPADEARLERELLAPLKVELYARARRLREAYTLYKRERNLLDYEDLQLRVLAALGDPAVRAEYAGRFRHLLLDEAQDTNPLQMQIVEQLLDGRGDLFAVGDVKQAIYGFRGASVDLFQGLHGGAGAGRLSLVDNFRSRSEVIAAVNAVGRRLWADGTLHFEALAAKLPYPAEAGSAPRIQVRLYAAEPPGAKGEADEADARKPTAADVRRHEAADLARWIRDAVRGTADRPPLEVWDRVSGRMRPARYEDVAILVRTRTHAPVYEQFLLREGIPFVKDGGRGFFSGLEIADVMNALRVALNPADEVALVAVLRSPMFGWSDEDLVRLRGAAGRRWLWRELERGFRPAAEGALGEAHEVLGALRALRHDFAPSELIEHLLEHTHYRAALLQTPQGRSRVANLRKLIDFARTSAADDGAGLRRFVERVEQAERHLHDEADAPLATEGAVTLATIHGAKGLEWPIVLLPTLESRFAHPASGSLYSQADGVLLVEPEDEQGGAIKPANHAWVREQMAAREEAEARRLFYVAMTRAREHLVLSGQPGYGGKEPDGFIKPVDWLCRALRVTAHAPGSRTELLDDAPIQVVCAPFTRDWTEPIADAGDEALAEARQRVARGEHARWNETKPEPADGPERVRVFRVLGPETPAESDASATGSGVRGSTVTRLAYFQRCPLVYYFDLVLQIEEHPRARAKAASATTGLTAVDLGSRVHALLERADFQRAPSEEAARLAARENGLTPGDRAHVERLLHNVLADPLIERVRRARRVEREYPFYLDVNGTTLHGVIDLLFIDEQGRAVVVDYKTNDLAAPDRVNVLTRYYRPQVELYALAVQQAGLADEVDEAVLFFLNQPVARSIPIDAARLAAVRSETAAVLERIGRGDWTTEPGEKCRGCGYRKRGFCDVGRQWQD